MSSRINDRCATCPWLETDQKRLKEQELRQDAIIRRATSDDLDEMAEAISAQLRESPPAGLFDAVGDIPNAKMIAGVMRTMGSRALSEVSQHIEKIEHDMEAMSGWCKGPVEMSTRRDGIVYSASVCASQFLLDEDLGVPEPATVRRYEL